MLPLMVAGGAAVAGGALSNYFGKDPQDDINKRMEEYYKQIQGRTAPQIGPASHSAVSGFRNNQQDLIQRLEAMSRGEGPSLAREQMKASTDRNMAQQSSIAQTGRGNAALAGITAANNSARLGAQSAQDTGMLRVQEQLGAFGQLGGAINQGRTSDEGNTQFNALQNNYRDQANLEAMLKSRGLDDQAIQSIIQGQMSMANRPRLGDQLMAGGAGLLSLGATQGKK